MATTVGSEVPAEALVASRRGRSLFLLAHNQLSIEKGHVHNAFLHGTLDDVPPGELAAEAVPELREALNPRDDEVVMLTGACHGLVDAPRRWRKSFTWDTQQLCLAQLPTRAMSDDLA